MPLTRHRPDAAVRQDTEDTEWWGECEEQLSNLQKLQRDKNFGSEVLTLVTSP